MVVVDEISFIKRPAFENLDKVLNSICYAPSPTIFGNLQMVFASDFCQLKPSNNFWQSLYIYKDCGLWYKGVYTSLELKTNHRLEKMIYNREIF